ncbi:MAG: hypothetical protein K9G62_02350 [Alphaproteobacteria bacterium]|nr:hypothetical protein [Alphaproteobacteria bacterium]
MKDKHLRTPLKSTAFRKKGAAFLLWVFLFALGIPSISHAATTLQPADDPCDPDYYDSLEARAWLEAQREITQNQNLIFKPDSVLEYTCFDLFLGELAEHAIDMFSENTRWGTILEADSMDNALESLVGTAFRSYLEDNFENTVDDEGNAAEYDLLGGRLNPGDPTNGSGLDYTNEADDSGVKWLPSIVGADYNCSIMNDVWKEAKCMDFIDVPEEDGFFTFEQYRDDPDKRFLPSRCEAIPDRWKENIELAWVDDYTKWIEDNMQTYLNWLDPDKCGSYPPVPTGLTVKNSQYPQGYPENVCIQPGCHYKPFAGCS